MNQKNSFDVVVIGAGITGISAGLVLNNTPLNWIILEAQNHIGGRLDSIVIDNVQVDTGAYEIAAFGGQA